MAGAGAGASVAAVGQRLPEFNAEQWLATQLNAYLADNDEYRATLRHLLHLGGQITYTPKRSTRRSTPPPPRPATIDPSPCEIKAA